MSWEAVDYIEKLRTAPNGQKITKDEKLTTRAAADSSARTSGIGQSPQRLWKRFAFATSAAICRGVWRAGGCGW